MQFPLSWLKEFVDINVSPQELDHIMTMAGLEVTDMRYIGLPEADLPWHPEKLVLGRILKVEQHPNADRLVLATVDIGATTLETVVTRRAESVSLCGPGRYWQFGLEIPLCDGRGHRLRRPCQRARQEDEAQGT